MEVESIPFTSVQVPVQATILCCNCGSPIDGTTAVGALCYDCVKTNVDISEGIQREATIHMCRDCDRWMSPPNSWVAAAPESRELLALCLRKLRGLNRARIIDASFIWTEPHSRRVKVKITIQQEVNPGTILQQTFEVEYVVGYHQCPDCQKSYTHNTWRANVQVRQKVPHKRTFLYLEQLILKHGAHKDTINIREVVNGIDFYFGQRNHAEKFVDFLHSVSPVNARKSQELISMDTHTSVKSYKFTYSVEIVPICKDDLVALPLKLARQIGNMAPLCLCYRVGTSLNFLDPNTLQVADVSTPIYWRAPFASLADSKELTEFIVMDIEPLGVERGRYMLAEATVRRAADLGANDIEYTVRTHLGAILHPGDSVMGYHLNGSNFNSPEYEALENSKAYNQMIPDVLLVKKVYPRRAKKSKSRNWRLKRMNREEGDVLPRKQDADRDEMEYEAFLRDVEEDPELRLTVNLYKQQQAEEKRKKAEAKEAGGDEMDIDGEGEAEKGGEDDWEDEEDGLEIPMDQLIDELDEMNIGNGN
jgi:nonsense-mediated mRNA decay protein 3